MQLTPRLAARVRGPALASCMRSGWRLTHVTSRGWTLLLCVLLVRQADAAAPFGSRWFTGGPAYGFQQGSNHSAVTWRLSHPQVVLTHVRRERLSEPGDTVIKRFRWRTEGLNACQRTKSVTDNRAGGFCKWPCAHDSASCLAGTGTTQKCPAARCTRPLTCMVSRRARVPVLHSQRPP